MNQIFITNKYQVFFYEKKEGTKGSFYLTDGKAGILPIRLSFTKEVYMSIRASQEKKNKLVGQIKTRWTKKDSGKYKELQEQNFKGMFNTSIFKADDFPNIYGYGDIRGTKDLIILTSSNNFHKSLNIHLFESCYHSLTNCLKYVSLL